MFSLQIWHYATVDMTSSSNISTDAPPLITFTESSTTTSASATPDAGYSAKTVVTLLTIIIGSAGAAANGVVLLTLIFHKDVGKNPTNVFICNQTVLDFVACITLIINTLVGFSNITSVNEFVDWLVCFLLVSDVLYIVPIYSSQAGLVIITVERYIKIVHPLAHRKHFRPWMIKMGIATPWITGIALYLIPNWATSRVVNGTCYGFAYWADDNMFEAYIIITFVIMLIIPMGIFMTCYARIIGVIKRQTNQVSVFAIAPGGSSETTGLSTGKSQSRKKVVKTMLLVCVSYCVCWFPIKFYIVGVIMDWLPIIGDVFYELTLLSYSNMLMNPIIYGTYFNVIGRIRHTAGAILKFRGQEASGQASGVSRSAGADATMPSAVPVIAE
jgi:G protein-coupled receptor 83